MYSGTLVTHSTGRAISSTSRDLFKYTRSVRNSRHCCLRSNGTPSQATSLLPLEVYSFVWNDGCHNKCRGSVNPSKYPRSSYGTLSLLLLGQHARLFTFTNTIASTSLSPNLQYVKCRTSWQNVTWWRHVTVTLYTVFYPGFVFENETPGTLRTSANVTGVSFRRI